LHDKSQVFVNRPVKKQLKILKDDADFTPLENAVRFGLTAIKGIGSNSVQSVIEARRTGNFTSLYDFAARLGQGAVNKRGLESLIAAGAFDSMLPADSTLHLWRARLAAGMNGALANGQKIINDRLNGQTGLFGGTSENVSVLEADLPTVPAWSPVHLANQEKAAVGFFLSHHPMDDYQKILADLKIINIADYEEIKPGDRLTLAGIANGLQVKYSKKGNRFCIFKLEDQSSGVKCLTWSEAYGKFSEILKDGELLIVEGRVEAAEGQEITIILEDVKRLADAVPLKARNVLINIRKKDFRTVYVEELVTLLSKHRGG